MHNRIALAAFLSLASTALAAVSKECRMLDLCFSLNIPDVTLSSGSNDLYLQITGPADVSWIGLAQGEHMAGAHYIIVYKSSDGDNVTVSARVNPAHTGHIMPTHDPATEFELLEGSGVHNGVLTANIKCTNCNSWNGGSMDLTAQSTNWIWAHSSGEPLHTDDPSTPIPTHDINGRFTFDSSSHGGASVNPFLTNSSTNPSHTPNDGSGATSHGPPKRIVRMYTAHAILACFAWAAIFPIGGIMIRLLSFPKLLWVHAILQIFGFCLYIAAVGLGIELSVNPRFWRVENKHVIIGLIIFILFFFQSFSGYLQHLVFKRYISRNPGSYIHIWTGRLCITLGMINAGFGFEITHKGINTWEVKTYTVFAVIVWVVYVISIIVGELRKKKAAAEPSQLHTTLSGIGSDTTSGVHSPVHNSSENITVPA